MTNKSNVKRIRAMKDACRECGGDCIPGECGKHPAGCILNPWSYHWDMVPGCPFEHPKGTPLRERYDK